MTGKASSNWLGSSIAYTRSWKWFLVSIDLGYGWAQKPPANDTEFISSNILIQTNGDKKNIWAQDGQNEAQFYLHVITAD